MTSFSQLWENQERERHHALIRQLKWELTTGKHKGLEFIARTPSQNNSVLPQAVPSTHQTRSARNDSFQHPTPRKRLNYEIR